MIFCCRAKGILTTLKRKIALLETLLKDIIAKLKLTQRLLTWLNSLFISIPSITLYLFNNANNSPYTSNAAEANVKSQINARFKRKQKMQ